MLREASILSTCLLLTACSPRIDLPRDFCEVVKVEHELAQGETLRIRGIFVPNAHHGAFLTGSQCRGSVMKVYFEPNDFPEYFAAAYGRGGYAVQIESDLNVVVNVKSEGESTARDLKIIRVNGFRVLSEPPG